MKYKITLEDKWFDAGKNLDHPSIRIVYHSLQEMKKSLEEIGTVSSIKGLEKLLRLVPSIPSGFSGKPYLDGKKIIVPTNGRGPGCYIGKVVKAK